MDEITGLFTVTQVAAQLGIQRNTVLRQISKGALHATKLGSVYVITAAEVARYRHTHLGRNGTASPDHPLHRMRKRGREEQH